MDIEKVVAALAALTSNHKRLNGKLCDHLTYSTPVNNDDLRTLVVMADSVTKSIRRVVDAVSASTGPVEEPV